MAESDLVGKITAAARRRIKLTIVGPCTVPPTKGGYAFYFGDEFAWPPVVNPDGIVVWVDPDEVHNALTKQRTPEPSKPETKPPYDSDGADPRKAGEVVVKPNPMPSTLSVPPELQ
jgi:hypothetical protein